MLRNIFCALLRPSTLEHQRQQGICLCFFSSLLGLVSFFCILISTKKLALNFLKRTSYTNVCLKFLCETKLTRLLLVFYFLIKIWSENSISILIHSVITFFWIWLFLGAKYQGRDEVERQGALMSLRWYDLDKLTVPCSSNLQTQLNVLC